MNFFKRIKIGHVFPAIYIVFVIIQMISKSYIWAGITSLILFGILYDHYTSDNSILNKPFLEWCQENSIAAVFFIMVLAFFFAFFLSIILYWL